MGGEKKKKPKNKDFLSQPNPKIPGKEGKRSKKQGILAGERNKEFQKNKERKDRVGSSQTRLFQTWLFAIFTWKSSFALFGALLQSFAVFCGLASALLRSFALFCAHLHVSANDRVGNSRETAWNRSLGNGVHNNGVRNQCPLH